MHLMRGDDEQALRYSKLASELGLGSGNDGIEATIAMRRGEWERAKTLLASQKGVPEQLRPELGPFVDAVADPAKRPAMVAKLRAVDPQVARQVDLIQPYLQLGQVDLVYDIVNDVIRQEGPDLAELSGLMHVWSVDARPFRADPRFSELARKVGYVDYWKQYGYPDGCTASRDGRALDCAS
jgi:hypothetical protein